MRRSRLFKYIPSSESIRNSRLLKPFGRHLQHHFLWQFNRQAVAGGAAVGMFFGILMPFAQIPFAALCAIALRVNLPVAAFATLVSNPLTFAPIYYLAYRLGNFLLVEQPPDETIGADGGTKVPEIDEKVDVLLAQQVEVSGWFDNLTAWSYGIGPALAAGLLVLALMAAVIAYLSISGLWRLYALQRWRRRPGFQPYRLRSWTARTMIPRQLALAVGLLGFLLVAFMDASTGVRVSLLPLHLLPTLFVTWYLGARWGLLFAFGLVMVQTLMGIREGFGHDLHWQIDRGADFLVVLLMIGLLARLRRMHQEMVHLVKHDSLTGTLNRNGFYAALDREIERGRRLGHPFSMVYFDCDDFKDVNEQFGHHAGDRVLARIARSLRDNTRRVDAVGRLGGDEFAILLPDTDRAAARLMAEHLKEKMDEVMKGQQWQLSFSIGVVSFENVPENIEAAIETADRLMSTVKKANKNDVAYATY